MALAYALNQGFDSKGLEIINYGAFLKRFPPVEEVEIDEGPRGEGTSWSCVHGVGRWKEDCGCSTGGRPGWNQKWRKPLREALDLLRDDLAILFEKEGEKIFKDSGGRETGISMSSSPFSEERVRFFERYGLEGLDESREIRGLRFWKWRGTLCRCTRAAVGFLPTCPVWKPLSFFSMRQGPSNWPRS
jgi:hypothetical protein